MLTEGIEIFASKIAGLGQSRAIYSKWTWITLDAADGRNAGGFAVLHLAGLTNLTHTYNSFYKHYPFKWAVQRDGCYMYMI